MQQYQTTGSSSQRPFSVNNPFRNISQTQQDTSIKQYENDEEFQQWVKQNQHFSTRSESRSPQSSQIYGRPKTNRSTTSFVSQRSSAFYEDEIFDQYEDSNKGNNKLEFQPPSALYQQRNISSHSVNSMNKKNPFLEDYEEETGYSDKYRQPTVQSSRPISQPSPSTPTYKSPPLNTTPNNYSRATDEKERVRRQYEINDRLMGDLPPSYDEIAPAARHAQPTGDVKTRTPSNNGNRNSSQHRSSNRERSDSHHRSGNRERSDSNYRSSKKENSSSSRKSKKPVIGKNVDTIDKLDVTGLFGGAFHHDGPFDACTPHRNKNKKAAPVLAFPKDGPNSSLAGKINASNGYQSKMNQVFGVTNDFTVDVNGGDDDDHVYSMDNSKMTKRGRQGEVINMNVNNISTDSLLTTGSSNTLAAVKNKNPVVQFDTNERAKTHGPVSQGLGSTTFLDGAPAAKDEEERQQMIQRSLSRKKSVSQRLGFKHDVENYTSGSISKVHSDGPDLEKSKSGGSKLLRRVKTLGRRS
ncbi:hypothetical protein QEN19_000881 [Hanseniaspora menglaensis]